MGIFFYVIHVCNIIHGQVDPVFLTVHVPKTQYKTQKGLFLRRNLNRQKAFHYRTQSYRHHTSGTQLHPQSTSSHPVCLTYHPIYVNVSQRKRTIHPTFSGAFPEIRFMSRLILSPILPIFIPPSRRGDGNSAAHGAINSKDECKK